MGTVVDSAHLELFEPLSLYLAGKKFVVLWDSKDRDLTELMMPLWYMSRKENTFEVYSVRPSDNFRTRL